MTSPIIQTIMPVTHDLGDFKVRRALPAKERTMGNKHIVPYALYCAKVFVSPMFSDHTGFDDVDLRLLFDALKHLFDLEYRGSHGTLASLTGALRPQRLFGAQCVRAPRSDPQCRYRAASRSLRD